MVSEDSQLGDDLKIATGFDDPEDMLSRIHQSVAEYVSLQNGLVGQTVGQRIAEAKLDSLSSRVLSESFPKRRNRRSSRSSTPRRQRSDSSACGRSALSSRHGPTCAPTSTRGSRSGSGRRIEQSEAFTGLKAQVAGKVDQSAFNSALANKLDVATLHEKLNEAADFSAFQSSLCTGVEHRRPSRARSFQGLKSSRHSTRELPVKSVLRSPPTRSRAPSPARAPSTAQPST